MFLIAWSSLRLLVLQSYSFHQVWNLSSITFSNSFFSLLPSSAAGTPLTWILTRLKLFHSSLLLCSSLDDRYCFPIFSFFYSNSTYSNWLISPAVYHIQYNFHLRLRIFISKIWFATFFLIFHGSPNFLNTRNLIIITVLMFFSANFNICINSGSVSVDWFSPHYGCFPSSLSSNFWLDDRHYEFHLVRCWIVFYFFKFSWALLWDPAKLLGNNLILPWFLRFIM